MSPFICRNALPWSLLCFINVTIPVFLLLPFSYFPILSSSICVFIFHIYVVGHCFFLLKFVFAYLFLAALGLHCQVRPLSSCGVWASLVASLGTEHRRHRLQWLKRVGSGVAARRLWSVGSVVVVYGLTCPATCEIFPDQGLSLALAGRFLSTGSPGKSGHCFYGKVKNFNK